MGNTSSQPLPKDEMDRLWVTPSLPVQQPSDLDRSPSLPTSTMNMADGDSQNVEDAALSRAARKQRRKEKRELKELRDARRSLRALRATAAGIRHQNLSSDVDMTLDVPDPSSQLLLEAAEHISRNGGELTHERDQLTVDGSSNEKHQTRSTGKHMPSRSAAAKIAIDQSNIDPSLRDPSQPDSSIIDSHSRHLVDWHMKQRADGRSKTNHQMKTIQLQDGVFAMVPHSAVQDHDVGFSDVLTQHYHANLRGGNPKSPNSSRSLAQAAVMLEVPLNQGGGNSYDISEVEDLAGSEHQEIVLPPAGLVRKQTKETRSTKRKRQSRATADEAVQSEAQPPKKRGRKSKVTTPNQAQIENDGAQVDTSENPVPASGPFSVAELDRIDEVAKSFRSRNDMSHRDFNAMVQNKDRSKIPVRDEFWQAVYDQLPLRQHVAIQRCARRRYHNYESRGKWTSDEDEMLKSLHALHPQKWVKIGEMMSRMPEDCRDRWRNYLVSEDNKRGVEWTQKEEMELSLIVQECASMVRDEAIAKAEAANLPFQEEDWNSMVNYNVVSERMGHSRSRLQCYQHWRLMQRRDMREEVAPTREPRSEWRKKSALKRYKNMKPRDKVAILYAIADSDTLEEHRIPWRLFRRTVADIKWTTMDRKVAFAKMKKLIPPQATLQETVEKLLDYFERHHKDQLEQPESSAEQEIEGEDDNDGEKDDEPILVTKSKKRYSSGRVAKKSKVEAKSAKKKAEKMKPKLKGKKVRGKRKAELSAEMVVNSSEDEGQVDSSEALATDHVIDLQDEHDEEPTSGQPESDDVENDEDEEEQIINQSNISRLFAPETLEIESEDTSDGQRSRLDEHGEVDDTEIKSEDDSRVSSRDAADIRHNNAQQGNDSEGEEEDDADSIVIERFR